MGPEIDMDADPGPEQAILLDAHAAIRCPVKVHNHHDPTITRQDDESLAAHDGAQTAQAWMTNHEFVDKVLDILVLTPEAVDLRDLACEDPQVRSAATRDAVESGASVIIAPRLPVDRAGARRGSPPLLVRGADTPEGEPGYLPVQIHDHRVLERHNRSWTICVSPLTTPLHTDRMGMIDARMRSGREQDMMLMAHYWRMLEAAGWASCGVPWAGLIGQDQLVRTIVATRRHEGEPALRLNTSHCSSVVLGIVWVDLVAKQIRTFARSSKTGWKSRSALERYDHEHAFRVSVARNALRRTGAPDDPAPMVFPIHIKECASCPWWPVCAPTMGADDLSRSIDKSPLDVREITVLRSMGISSVNDLVEADLEALMGDYLPEVSHRDGAETRLRLAAHRANLIASGIELERTNDKPMRLPASRIEIDWDIEAAPGDRIYLWGFLVRDRECLDDHGHYVSFARFREIDSEIENELAIEAMTWLNQILDAHPDARIYHYSDYEMVHLTKVARSSGHPQVIRGLERMRRAHFDLFSTMRRHWFGVHGLGLKSVAHAATGFDWRDEAPGGLNSQMWFLEALRTTDQQARSETMQRILDYNEDDVRATMALRDWLRTQD